MFEVEEHTGCLPRVSLVNQDTAAPHQVSVTLKCKVERSIKKRMPGAYECSERLTLRSDKRFLEGYSFAAREHRLSHANEAVSVADRRGDVSQLVSSRLALSCRST